MIFLASLNLLNNKIGLPRKDIIKLIIFDEVI